MYHLTENAVLKGDLQKIMSAEIPRRPNKKQLECVRSAVRDTWLNWSFSKPQNKDLRNFHRLWIKRCVEGDLQELRRQRLDWLGSIVIISLVRAWQNGGIPNHQTQGDTLTEVFDACFTSNWPNSEALFEGEPNLYEG